MCPSPCTRPPFPQVLGTTSKPGGFSAELHEVHRQLAVPPLPLHRCICLVGDAAVWRTVSITTNLRRSSTASIKFEHLFSYCTFSFLLLRFNFDDGTPPTNFDTFAAAIMTVFQVGKKALCLVS